MELKVDNTKTYTYGDWVRGSILLGATDSTINEVQVELRGVMIQGNHVGLSDGYEKTLYVLKRDVSYPQFDQNFQGKTPEKSCEFAIQFPEYKHGAIIPSTFGDLSSGVKIECRHTVIVEVVTGKHSKRTIQESKVLQFMHTESVKLLSAPNEVCSEQNSIGLSAIAELELPLYLAQDGIDQKVFIRLLAPEVTGLQVVSAQALIRWIYQSKPVPRLLDVHIGLWDFNPKPEDNSAIEGTIRLQKCNFPIHYSDDVNCGYIFDAQLNVFNSRAQRYQSLAFSKPVLILPARLHKGNPGCFATKEEMRNSISVREGNLINFSSAIGEVSDIEAEAPTTFVSSYSL